MTACVGFSRNLRGVITVLSGCVLFFLHDATFRRWNESGVGGEGGGDEMDGVADVVVEGCFGVARAVEEVVSIFVNELPSCAAGKGVGWEER